MCVDGGRADVLVSEQFLQPPEVHARIVKMSGARVAQLVWADLFAFRQKCGVSVKDPVDRPWRDSCSVPIEEQGLLVLAGRSGELALGVGARRKIVSQCPTSGPADRDKPLLSAFAENANLTGLSVNVEDR